MLHFKLFVLLFIVFSPILMVGFSQPTIGVDGGISNSIVGQTSSSNLHPSLTLVDSVKRSWNWTYIWSKFKDNMDWNLESNNGTGWVSIRTALKIIKNIQNDTCKITLNFTAPYTANYRLTFAVTNQVLDYVHVSGDLNYTLQFNDFKILFDWSDIKSISGITITHGILNNYFWFRIGRDSVSKNVNLIIDPYVRIIDTGSSPLGEWANQFQRRTYTNGVYYYVFYLKGVSGFDIESLFNIKYAYGTDGYTWTIATLSASVQFGGQTYGNTPMSIYGNGTHIGIVTSEGDDARPDFRLAQINSDGTLTLVSHVAGLFGTSGPTYVNGYHPSITQDSSGYWHVIADWEATQDSYVYYVISLDTSGATWNTTYVSLHHNHWNYGDPRQPHFMSIQRLTTGIVAIYGTEIATSSLYSSSRHANGSWETEQTAIVSIGASSAYYFSSMYDRLDEKIILNAYDSTAFKEYDLTSLTGTWTYISTINTGENGALCTEPTTGDYYNIVGSGYQYASVQNRTQTDTTWCTRWIPSGWYTTNQGYNYVILANEQVNNGMLIAMAVNGSTDSWNWIALTMTVATTSMSLSISTLNANHYVEAQEAYTYNFTIVHTIYDPNISNVTMYFSDGAGQTIELFFNNITSTWTVTSNICDDTIPANSSYDGSQYFYLWITLLYNSEIVDKVDVNIIEIVWFQDNTSISTTLISAFGFYAKGGFVTSTFTGGGARLTGGDVWDFVVNGTSGTARGDVIYKRFQDLHLLFKWSPYGDAGQANTTFGVDFWYNGSWREGWKVKLHYKDYILAYDTSTPSENYNGTTWSHYIGVWLRYYVDWYYGGTLIRSDLVQGLLEDFQANDNHMKLWVDLWFNRLNASTVVGGRIASYYYGYEDHGAGLGGTPPVGYWEHSDYLANISSVSMFYHDLNVDNELIPCTEAEAMKIYSLLEYSGSSGKEPRNRGFTTLNWMTAKKGLMIGIDTPAFEESRQPTMDWKALGVWWYGWSSPLIGAFSWIVAGLGDVFKGIYSWLMPYLTSMWSLIWTWLCGLPYIGGAFVWFGQMFTYLTTLLGIVFTFISSIFLGISGFFAGLITVYNTQVVIFGLIFVTYGQLINVVIIVLGIELVREGMEGNWNPLVNTLTIIWGVTMFFISWGWRFLVYVSDRILGGLPI